MANKPPLVAARYIGDYPVVLSRQHGPVYAPDTVDADGTIVPGVRIDGTLIGKGDQVMMPAAEVLGQTYWHDPQRQQPSLSIGVGAVVRPEHAGLSRAQLMAIGYDFHEGRRDFEAVVAAPAAPQATSQAAQPLDDSVALPDDAVIVPDEAPSEPAEEPEEPSVTAEPASDAADPAQGA
ncbi:MAG TPA: hypothetical protein VMV29_23400 [Ktedonobacterales bacterium]|nr:hypothetical protein [Ktedonobacterales bacterium]